MSEKKRKPAPLSLGSPATDSPDGGGIIAVDTTSKEYVGREVGEYVGRGVGEYGWEEVAS